MRTLLGPIAVLILALAGALAGGRTAAADDVTLRVFVGGQERPDVMRPLFDRFQADHPGIKVDMEVGGATSDAQQQYLTTVLTSRDPALDVILIDVVRPAQYAAAGWAEPLDPYLGADRQTLLADYLPAYSEAVQVDGKLIALPAFADALHIYYRTDLLAKYGLPAPASWADIVADAQAILAGERDPQLQGLSFQGAPIESTNCTFLVPFWSLGGSLVGPDGKVQVQGEPGRQALQFWLDTMATWHIAKPTIAEVRTDDTRLDFQNGHAAFALLWAYGWNLFQSDASAVKGKVAVIPVPAFDGGKPTSCLGGWAWAVSAFSTHKQAAVDLVRFLAGPVGSKHLAIHASNVPALSAVLNDPEVLARNPWFATELPALAETRSRPVSPRYAEISDIIRTNVNAVLAGIKQPDAALSDMQARLQRVLK